MPAPLQPTGHEGNKPATARPGEGGAQPGVRPRGSDHALVSDTGAGHSPEDRAAKDLDRCGDDCASDDVPERDKSLDA